MDTYCCPPRAYLSATFMFSSRRRRPLPPLPPCLSRHAHQPTPNPSSTYTLSLHHFNHPASMVTGSPPGLNDTPPRSSGNRYQMDGGRSAHPGRPAPLPHRNHQQFPTVRLACTTVHTTQTKSPKKGKRQWGDVASEVVRVDGGEGNKMVCLGCLDGRWSPTSTDVPGDRVRGVSRKLAAEREETGADNCGQ